MVVIDINCLYDYYISTNHSITECSSHFNVSRDTIKRLLKKHKIVKPKDLVIELRKHTNLSKYGGNAPASDKSIVNKMKETKLKRYGSVGYNNIEKIKATNLCKYGVENVSQSEIIRQKRSLMQEQSKQTCILKYGTTEYWKDPLVHQHYIDAKEKRRQTCLQKFGENYYTQSQNFKNNIQERTLKTQKTCFDRYGVFNVSQCLDFSQKRGTHYQYNGMTFDSSWELALWIYCQDHGEEIIRNPCRYEYYYKDELHFYIPDFKYQGEIIEIKGPQFFEGDKMICPFDRTLDDLFETKHQCMINNQVKIWGENDIQFAIVYVSLTYGHGFLKKHKRK